MLFEMIAGRIPFYGKTTAETRERILKGIPDIKLPKNTPKQLSDLVFKMMQPDKDQRPSILDIIREPYVQKHV